MRKVIENDELSIQQNRGYFPAALENGAAGALRSSDSVIS